MLLAGVAGVMFLPSEQNTLCLLMVMLAGNVTYLTCGENELVQLFMVTCILTVYVCYLMGLLMKVEV